MKKILFISMLILGSGAAIAQPVSQVNVQNISTAQNFSSSLSDADKNMIFGSEVNAMPLDNQEMMHTQGFGFWSNFWTVVGVGAIVTCAAFTGGACAATLAF